MRVGILALMQESNTFLPATTHWDDFANETLARGSEVRTQFADAPHEIGGFFGGLQTADLEAVPIFAARAMPYGTIDAESFTRLIDTMCEELLAAGPLDGLLVAPHGATVSQQHLDVDGYWLGRVREMVGPDLPMVGTLDPHANLSPKMVDACDALIAYRTNPHVDQRERGEEAASLIARMLKEGLRPTMAAQFPPTAISIESQCTEESPCRELYQIARQMLDEPGVLTNSILLGFPYADVPEMGSAVIVVTEDDLPRARQYARSLAGALWERREAFVVPMPDVEEAIELALKADPPVCLLDMGDNIGGGSPADSTWLAHALFDKQVDRSLIALYDPEAVRRSQKAGAGATLELHLGDHSGSPNGGPLVARCKVESLHEGRFTESEALHGGFSVFDQGPTAVLTTSQGLTVVVTSRRMVPFSLGQLTSCGLDPASYRILVAKGVNAPIAAYRPVCKTFLRVNTPGCTCADMTMLDFQQRRRPMFPFEQDATWE